MLKAKPKKGQSKFDNLMRAVVKVKPEKSKLPAKRRKK
jgi:hypothetical protein